MLDVIPEKVAEIFVVSGVRLKSVASPWKGGVLLIEIFTWFDEDQVTDFVKSWKLPSLKTPVAVNCSELP